MALSPPLPITPLKVFSDLRDLLADTYRDRLAIEYFLREREGTRLKARDLDLTHSAAVSWQNILERAHQEGTLDTLLLEVARDRPGIAASVVKLADAYGQTLPLSRIRRELAGLYPSVSALEEVLRRFNAEPSLEGQAPPGADVEARWQAVLERAHSQGSLPALVRRVAREHPGHADALERVSTFTLLSFQRPCLLCRRKEKAPDLRGGPLEKNSAVLGGISRRVSVRWVGFTLHPLSERADA